MTGFLTKVILLLLVLGANAGNYNIETTDEFFIIKSEVDTVVYNEINEQFSLLPLFNHIARMNDTLQLITGLLDFNNFNQDCVNVGNLNSNTDDLIDLIEISKSKNITMMRMQISETAQDHRYVGYLINQNHEMSCTLTNSVSSIQYLMAQNTFRTYPVNENQVINYRDNMLSQFRDSTDRSCIRQGRFPESFITRKFVVSEPKIETCTKIL